MTKRKSTAKKQKPSSKPLTPVHDAQYVITDEPMPDRRYRKLPKHIQDKIERLYQDAQRKPQQAIPELLRLKKKYPRVPQIYNYLSVAYSGMGDFEKAKIITQENLRRNPDYLFARLNYADICLKEKRYNEIPKIFEHKYDLKALYPKRKRFHISEFANFMGTMGMYFYKTDQRELAEQYNNSLQEIAPNYPMAKRLNRALYPSIFTRMKRRLFG